ncbi:recombinase family protein [Lichenihabitans sp. Uapishka_5]|uniref:recombinase family protein n=1 Tax=Lichenihabitans sp. Uapishka_5 TaxID=3037302 RepID=UPI0029E80332|nr:recombinase family protein [Lichenihabitans sp. Uapishka_5]MDX7953450.1 recombinase family protein [Lichenihabitans sp. Uapishka_5]
MARIGYTRVSTSDQDHGSQEARLKSADCDVIRAEKVSGKNRDGRDELATVMDSIRPDDELVVVKLDRLGRSTRDVLNLVHELEGKGAALTVLEPSFSTKDATGSILVTVLGMVAEMERKFIRERQQIGIEAAKGRGAYTGRKVTAPIDKVRQLHAVGMGPTAIARETGLSRMHVYRLTKGLPAPATP